MHLGNLPTSFHWFSFSLGKPSNTVWKRKTPIHERSFNFFQANSTFLKSQMASRIDSEPYCSHHPGGCCVLPHIVQDVRTQSRSEMSSVLPPHAFFLLFKAAPTACGSSQARGQIGVAVASLRHIWAASATYTTVHSNVRSLIHWARPGIKPTSSWIPVGFLTTEPRQELHYAFFILKI